MKPLQKGFVFFAIQELSSCEGNSFGWTAIRTNREGKILSVFSTDSEDPSLLEQVKQFREWMTDILEYKIVGVSHEQFNRFVMMLEREYVHVFPRHINRLLKSQYWNLMSELCYKFKMPETTLLKDFLFLYGHNQVLHRSLLMQECLNVMELTKLYLFDKERTKKLCKRDLPNAYRDIYKNYSLDKLLEELFQHDMQVSIKRLLDGTHQTEVFSSTFTTPYTVIHQDLHECLLRSLLLFHLEKSSKKNGERF